MINLGPVHRIEVVDVFDHQLDEKPTDRSGDTFENQGNPQERLHWTVAWTGNVYSVHDQGVQVGQSADEVGHSLVVRGMD